MLRTIASGGNLVKRTGSLVKVARGTFTRSFSLECAKRKLHNPSPFRKNTLIPKQLQWHYQIRHYSSDLPSHIRVTLPALSPTMESGTIVSWEKKEGDKLNEGDLLAEIETDKATMGFETPEEGYLAKILVPAGSKGIPIGKLVCIIVENEADVAAFKDFKDDGAAASAPAPPSPAAAPPPPAAAAPKPPVQPTAVPPPPPPQDTGRVYASPMAKRLAEQRNIRLQGKGSGLYGSITSSDLDSVDAASAAAPLALPPKPAPGATYVDIPLTNMRTVIAKRLLQSKQSVPHYFITMDVNVDRALQVRAKFNKRLEKDKVKLTINDFVLKATAMACRKVREANSAWMDTFIREYHNVDISVAVATEKGLITPIIFNADNKGLVEINTEMKALAQKARDGKLQPHEFQGGTISVSNLGMFGVAHFCAIINPPQSCILAIGGTQKRFVPADNEKGFDVASYMSVTLSSDHRVVDGAVGARWLQAFRDNMEDPEHMIL